MHLGLISLQCLVNMHFMTSLFLSILTFSYYFLDMCIYLIIPGHLAMLLYDSEARGGETKTSTEGMYCNKDVVSNTKEIPIYFRYLL